MYGITNNQLPHFTPILINSNVTGCMLNNNFLLPQARTSYCKQTIHFSGISFYDGLSLDLKRSRSLNEIKMTLKDHIMSTSPPISLFLIVYCSLGVAFCNYLFLHCKSVFLDCRLFSVRLKRTLKFYFTVIEI